MRQPPIDRPFHNGRDSLPVHPVMRGRLLPAQLARQPGDDFRQRLRNALPLVSPGQMLDARATCWTAHPDRRISQDQGPVAYRQVAPLALHLTRMNPCRPSRAVAANQSATRDPFDFRHQSIWFLENPSNSMAFQTQAFSDTSFQAHRQRPSFRSFGTRTKDSRNADAPFPFSRLQSHHTFGRRTLFEIVLKNRPNYLSQSVSFRFCYLSWRAGILENALLWDYHNDLSVSHIMLESPLCAYDAETPAPW